VSKESYNFFGAVAQRRLWLSHSWGF